MHVILSAAVPSEHTSDILPFIRPFILETGLNGGAVFVMALTRHLP